MHLHATKPVRALLPWSSFWAPNSKSSCATNNLPADAPIYWDILSFFFGDLWSCRLSRSIEKPCREVTHLWLSAALSVWGFASQQSISAGQLAATARTAIGVAWEGKHLAKKTGTAHAWFDWRVPIAFQIYQYQYQPQKSKRTLINSLTH